MKKIFNIIFIIAVVVAGFLYRESLKNVWAQSWNHYFPCTTAISYSVNSFDTRFGLSKTDFIKALSSAEAIWEKPINKNLFKYETDGILKINLIYDTRQETTVKLKEMGLVMQNTKASYEELKAKYNSVLAQYKISKADFEAQVSAFNTRKDAYEAEVESINKKGGANKQTIAKLNAEKDALNQEINVLNNMQSKLNNDVDSINALAKALNQLATSLNIKVGEFNTIGDSLGGEFEEGTYTSSTAGQQIDIYQFDNQSKLVRVLAHELGHALGLDHIEDTKAIMYRLNNGVNEKLTSNDLVQLKQLCGIK